MVDNIKELKKKIELASLPDAKAALMLSLANTLLGTDTDNAYEIADAAGKLASDIGDQKLIAESYKIKGLSYYINSKPKEAMEYFTEAVKIYTTLDDFHGMAGVTLNMGIVKMKQGAYPEALAFCEQAANLYKTGDHDPAGLAKCYNNIGVIYERTGEYIKALEMFEKSIAQCKITGNMREAEHAEANIGLVYKSLGWSEQALEKMLHCMDVYGKDLNKLKYCASLINIGDIYVELNNLNKGLEYFQLALKMAKEIDNPRYLGTCYVGLGKIFCQLGGRDESKGYFQKALDIFLVINEPDGSCAVYVGMGNCYLTSKEYDTAQQYFEDALQLALEHGFQHEQFEIYRSLVTLYNAIGRPEDAAFMEAKSLPLRVLYRS